MWTFVKAYLYQWMLKWIKIYLINDPDMFLIVLFFCWLLVFCHISLLPVALTLALIKSFTDVWILRSNGLRVSVLTCVIFQISSPELKLWSTHSHDKCKIHSQKVKIPFICPYHLPKSLEQQSNHKGDYLRATNIFISSTCW